MQYVCPSPAKINWFLHITGQRPDGYHELQTLFQFVELNDWLTFNLRHDGQIQLDGDLAGVSAQQNLVYKAAMALKPYAVDEAGININITKNIPTGAGLGGGSSNAATTLLMLNQLWQLQLSNQELATLAVKLGADVPIFVTGHSAFAQGIGEDLTKTKLDTANLLLAMPKHCHISTADIFTSKALKRDSLTIEPKQYSFDSTHNDCQSIATSLFPVVANTLRWLVEYAPSRMTGTGACCFGVFDTLQQANEVALDAPDYLDCYVVETHNISSTHRFIAEHF